MRRTYKYRIYPTHSQVTYFENVFSMCRHLYNWSLKERMDAYKSEGRSINYFEQQNALPKLKKERPWFKGVYSLTLQDVLRRLDKAYAKFFDKKGGFPKYKKKGQWSSLTYPDHSKFPVDGKVKVAKIGDLKIVYHREIPKEAKIQTLTITKEGGKWFACFSLDLPDQREPKQKVDHLLGIDLGLESFVYDSDGNAIQAPRFLRRKLKDLQRLQRKLSRTKKRTAAYRKVLNALQKAYYRVRCMRQDFFYKLSHQLFAKSDIVFYEELAISKMVESAKVLPGKTAPFRRAIYDASWGSFVCILKSVAERLGKVAHGVDPAYTSQICSQCRFIEKKSLSTRTHICSHCGYRADRDYNAAKNILRLGLESLGLSLEAPTILQSI